MERALFRQSWICFCHVNLSLYCIPRYFMCGNQFISLPLSIKGSVGFARFREMHISWVFSKFIFIFQVSVQC